MENNKASELYSKKILKFKNKRIFDDSSIINIILYDDILTEVEHKVNINKRIVDTVIEQKFPVSDNTAIIINDKYDNTLRLKSYAHITKKDPTVNIETYTIIVYNILNVSHVLIRTKHKTNNKSLLIYDTVNDAPNNIISNAIATENLEHYTVIEKSDNNKILSNDETTKIISAINNSDPNTDPVITIPLANTLDPVLLEFYYLVLNNSYISKTPDDILLRLAWIILNL